MSRSTVRIVPSTARPPKITAPTKFVGKRDGVSREVNEEQIGAGDGRVNSRRDDIENDGAIGPVVPRKAEERGEENDLKQDRIANGEKPDRERPSDQKAGRDGNDAGGRPPPPQPVGEHASEHGAGDT